MHWLPENSGPKGAGSQESYPGRLNYVFNNAFTRTLPGTLIAIEGKNFDGTIQIVFNE